MSSTDDVTVRAKKTNLTKDVLSQTSKEHRETCQEETKLKFSRHSKCSSSDEKISCHVGAQYLSDETEKLKTNRDAAKNFKTNRDETKKLKNEKNENLNRKSQRRKTVIVKIFAALMTMILLGVTFFTFFHTLGVIHKLRNGIRGEGVTPCIMLWYRG